MKVSTPILLILFLGCASTKPQADDATLQSWVGAWRGVALVEGASDLPDEWLLRLTKDRNHLQGRISSRQGLFTGIKVDNLKVTANELSFSFSYETSRGLRAQLDNSAIRENHKLLSIIQGSEGGRKLRGRWEARYEP